MELSQILLLVGKALQLVVENAPGIIKTIDDAKPMALALFKAFKGTEEVTAEEEAAVYGMVQELSRQLQEPLPPE